MEGGESWLGRKKGPTQVTQSVQTTGRGLGDWEMRLRREQGQIMRVMKTTLEVEAASSTEPKHTEHLGASFLSELIFLVFP